ncbi:sister chromatid cohesion 1 protein 4 isoform X2 [Andrographis paniculata]|uniref:sister chromatid cohesion 1 protein 4 isoform X2 n=1 Tax=Andrographis paniculata TaxID=175694 RepID=UPI0021E75443|nr:sister chromatid cohesion 1 protein 4 isoform X2 [Andrographis paniculata]
MFYSQFILAKKGPLGTIWIAAHLERKLRKNQVADTDIGVSVDSILSPDVPIALRLSSHLLLGVVRIYSRKVNYLFDDCSEALLKIKQAFRSTAVDLPPEESKAPYHSITLPETFDLDDFELPDNDIFQSNFVDHHISSREQITLQDTMEGVTYSTSTFGLDERFGDGDASGLDLEEELLMGKIGAAGPLNESADPQASTVSMTPPKPEDEPDSRMLNNVDAAPCTPGLVDEPNLSNVQEVSACDDHLESECHLVESKVTKKAKSADEDKHEVDCFSSNTNISNATPAAQTEENSHQPISMDIDLSKQQGEFPVDSNVEHVSLDEPMSGSKPASDLLDNVLNPASELIDKTTEVTDDPSIEGLQIESASKGEDSSFPDGKPCDDHQGVIDIGLEKSSSEAYDQTSMSHQAPEVLSANDPESLGTEAAGDQEKLCQPASNLDSENKDELHSQNCDTQPPHSSLLNADVHDSGSPRPTDSEMQSKDVALDLSEGVEVQDKACLTTDDLEASLKTNHVQEDAHASSRELEGEAHPEDSHDKLMENQDKPAETEVPAPEKLLSVPDGHLDQQKNILIEESPGALDDGDAGSKNLSGKKRSFTESTLTEQSLNSVESSGLAHFKRKVESVPDDDDLLSSILVGRSSVLKVKPTPRLSEATSVKRTRLASRTAAPKRKVLMDDTMVLHGDTIRQQLTNTEDIRRLRKKAPCTLPEISVIQKQHLEDEIFLGPILTGVSDQLSSLHSQIWDLRRITVCKNDLDGFLGQAMVETGMPTVTEEKAGSHDTTAGPSITSHDVKNDDSLTGAAEQNLNSQNAENDQTPDTKSENGSGEPNATEQSEMTVPEEVLLDGDNSVAKQTVNSQPSDTSMKEPGEIYEVNNEQPEATDHMDAGFSVQELLLDENGVEKSQKENDDVNSSASAGGKPPDSTGDASVDVLDNPSNVIQDGSIKETSEANLLAEADTSAALPPAETDVPYIGLDSTPMDIDNEQIIDTHSLVEKDGDVNAAVDTEPVTQEDFLLGVVSDGGNVELFPNAENEHIGASLYPDNIDMGDDGFMNNGENPEPTEAYQSYMLNEESGFDLHGQEDLNYYAAGNDTEFLNVDDDDLTEIDDINPDDEEAQFAENTGWSSRTRAVSKYLQTLFIKEAEHGKKALSMDNLLTGKSRKEASRMFFEALVLKTRDYIHVEQHDPFDDIAIKPRVRLLKSDF